MDERYQFVKSMVVNFKLNNCCYMAPVRVGLFITAYFNIIYDLASIVGIADESYSPIIMQVAEAILEDNATKPIPILCYSAEFAFNGILLCAIHRRDMPLMRLYINFCVAATVISILFYSVVIISVGALIKIALILSILFQLYVILLVRSAIVEMKLLQRGPAPIIVMSSLTHETKESQTVVASPTLTDDVESSSQNDAEAPPKHDVEAPLQNVTETISEVNEEVKNHEDKKVHTQLETVQENPKDRSQ